MASAAASPTVDIEEPAFMNETDQASSRSSEVSNNQSRKHHKKNSSSSKDEATTSQNNHQISDEESHGSLSDLTRRRGSHQHLSVDGKDEKRNKKKNRISQIIAGVTYKSKSDLFNKLFKDMSTDEELIVDYSCALLRDILVHGRLYLSQTWLCFYANIFGWETLVTLRWSEITAITKEKTAKVIPNAIQINTRTDKYFFTTFVARAKAYTAMFRIWQNALLGQPNGPGQLKSLCRNKRANEVLDGDPVHDHEHEVGNEVNEDDSRSVASSESPEEASKSIDSTSTSTSLNNSMNSNSNHNTASTNTNNNNNNNNNNSNVGMVSPETIVEDQKEERSSTWDKAHNFFHKKKNRKAPRKPAWQLPGYQLTLPLPDPPEGETTTDFYEDETDNEEEEADGAPDDINVLCPCHDSHLGKEYCNEEFNFDVDALFEHLFSQDSDTMNRVFGEKNFENYRYTELKEIDGNKTQTLSYTLPLNYSIGPKESHTENKQIFSKDNVIGSCYVIEVLNSTNGVPYADSFKVSLNYCLTRLTGNRSRLRVHGELTYTKKVFGLVKNIITRSADDAMNDYFSVLVNILHKESSLHPHKIPRLKKNKKQRNKEVLSKKTSLPVEHRASSVTPNKQSDLSNLSINELQKGSISPLPTIYSQAANYMPFIFILLVLFGMNIYLLGRLRYLENAVNLERHVFSKTPSTPSEWNGVLNYQRNVHTLQLKKLCDFVTAAADLLKQAEN